MADAAGLLQTLIQAAGRAVERPVVTMQDGALLDRLATDVAAAAAQPAPDRRDIHDVDHLLAQALAMHARAVAHDRPRAAALQQVIGVLLPVARQHFSEALETARGGRPA
jgi:hypothetical protein